MKNRLIIYISAALITLGACKFQNNTGRVAEKETMTPVKYSSWIAENQEKLTVNREMSDIHVEARFVPNEVLVLRTSQDKASADYAEALKSMAGTYNFIVRISASDNVPVMDKTSEYYKSDDTKMMYWSSGIQKQLKLIAGNDTLPCSMVLFENTGNSRPDILINIGFEGKKADYSNMTLVYDDDYFSLGRLNFEFDNETLKQLPTIH